MALKAGRVGVRKDQVDVNGIIDMSNVPTELPSYSSSDEGKVLSVDSSGDLEFVNVPTELPSYSSSDNGKVLSVDSSGDLEFVNVPTELPSYSSSDEGKVLSVDSSGDLEFKLVSNGGFGTPIKCNYSDFNWNASPRKTFDTDGILVVMALATTSANAIRLDLLTNFGGDTTSCIGRLSTGGNSFNEGTIVAPVKSGWTYHFENVSNVSSTDSEIYFFPFN